MAANEPVGDAARRYLNRLSDLFFVSGTYIERAPANPMCSGERIASAVDRARTARTRMPTSDTDRSARLADLLARTALSDQAAFAELYRLAAPHLYGVALRILREPALAEDLLQEAFVNVWHHAGSYNAAKAKPQTWLTSIVRNRCLDSCGGASPIR
jgi:hypothetical protein